MTEPLSDKQIDALIALYLVGSLPTDALPVFERWLFASPENPRRVARLSITSFCLHEVCQDSKSDYLLDILNQIDDAAGHAELVTLHHLSAPRHNFKLYAIAGSIAAMLILGITFTFVLSGTGSTASIVEKPREPGHIVQANPVAIKPTVATLTAERDAVWSSPQAEGALAPGSLLRPGQYLYLTQGFAEITTGSGAIAIFEAPARFELANNDNAIKLHSGKLVCICETESSKGFQVLAPHMNVTDLGTRFGVQVSDEGEVYTAVFEGEVIAHGVDTVSNEYASLNLAAGQAVNASPATGLDDAPHALPPDHTFLPSWRDINGQVQVTGQARFFITPPADISPNALIDPDHLILFQEQTATLDQPIRLLTEMSENARRPTHTTVPAGTKVISYMIHFSPAEFLPRPDGKSSTKEPARQARAQLRFPGRVLGLVSGSNALASTNELFGLDSVVYVDPEDTIYNNQIDGFPGDRVVITGENQDTLDIQLGAVVHCDQARILIEVPDHLITNH